MGAETTPRNRSALSNNRRAEPHPSAAHETAVGRRSPVDVARWTAGSEARQGRLAAWG